MVSRQRAGVATLACASGVALYAARKCYRSYVSEKGRLKAVPNSREESELQTGIDVYSCSALQQFMEKNEKKKSPEVNKVFLKQLIKLLRLSIPSIFSKEAGLLFVHTCSLVARTFLSIYIAHLDGRLVKSIVDRRPTEFLRNCLTWIMIALPATFLNSLIRYLECKLSLAIRTRLVNYAYSLYFSNQTYYRVSNMDGRLANPDHSLTEDLQAFSSAVTHIYSHLSKPFLDIALMSSAFARVARKRGDTSNYPMIIALSITFFTGCLLKVCSPRFGKIVAEESRRNAHLRYIHSRLIANSEEIAFYGGHQV